jgi:hypothetical protein
MEGRSIPRRKGMATTFPAGPPLLGGPVPAPAAQHRLGVALAGLRALAGLGLGARRSQPVEVGVEKEEARGGAPERRRTLSPVPVYLPALSR